MLICSFIVALLLVHRHDDLFTLRLSLLFPYSLIPYCKTTYVFPFVDYVLFTKTHALFFQISAVLKS